MRLLLLLTAGLAAPVLAVPGQYWTTSSSSRPLGTGTSSLTSSTTGHNKTTTSPPPKDTHTPPPPGPGTLTSVYTTTETVTRFSLTPCSTAVSVSGSKTFYSTYVSTSAYTTTTCYPVTTVMTPTSKITDSPAVPNPPCPATCTPAHCPNQPTTIYITSLGPQQTVIPAPPTCTKACQTITYIDSSSTTITIIVPSQTPDKPEPTDKPTETGKQPPSPPYPTPSGTKENPSVGPTGTGGKTSPTTSHKPH